MLDGTIAENIAFGLPAIEIDQEKIRQLILDLDLKNMIDQLPLGTETPIGERGIKLSGGQRQRIAIARALYCDTEVLLLDEITNQLDALTEREILCTLEKISSQNKTILMITHHTNLLPQFSRIIRLENGILREEILAKTTD
jgi:ATP-binding cassette, subfamily B, bacterial PglK